MDKAIEALPRDMIKVYKHFDTTFLRTIYGIIMLDETGSIVNFFRRIIYIGPYGGSFFIICGGLEDRGYRVCTISDDGSILEDTVEGFQFREILLVYVWSDWFNAIDYNDKRSYEDFRDGNIYWLRDIDHVEKAKVDDMYLGSKWFYLIDRNVYTLKNVGYYQELCIANYKIPDYLSMLPKPIARYIIFLSNR